MESLNLRYYTGKTMMIQDQGRDEVAVTTAGSSISLCANLGTRKDVTHGTLNVSICVIADAIRIIPYVERCFMQTSLIPLDA